MDPETMPGAMPAAPAKKKARKKSSSRKKAGAKKKAAIVDWGFNAWGGKYPPFDADDRVPTEIALSLNLPAFYPDKPNTKPWPTKWRHQTLCTSPIAPA